MLRRDVGRVLLDVCVAAVLCGPAIGQGKRAGQGPQDRGPTSRTRSLPVSIPEILLSPWGGKNADGSEGFNQHRPGWEAPIRGMQTALLRARLADAKRNGCEIGVVVTQPASKSQQNVQREGFTATAGEGGSRKLTYTRANNVSVVTRWSQRR
jgi:hypothetical protein